MSKLDEVLSFLKENNETPFKIYIEDKDIDEAIAELDQYRRQLKELKQILRWLNEKTIPKE